MFSFNAYLIFLFELYRIIFNCVIACVKNYFIIIIY